jgi:hypothetical protein
MEDDYNLHLEINCGVWTGAGKYSDTIKLCETFSAENYGEACKRAYSIMENHALDHLTDPADNSTTVRMISLEDGKGNNIPIDEEKSVVTVSGLEHMLGFRFKKRN